MAMLNRTTDATVGSVLSTINPISTLIGTKDYVPQSVLQIGRNLFGGKNKYADQVSHVVYKTGVSAAAAAAAILIARALAHASQVESLDSLQTPGHYALKDINTARGPLLSAPVKTASANRQLCKKAFDFYANPTQSAAVWAPPAAFILAGLLSYKLSDKAFDKMLSKRLDESIARNNDRFNRYVLARAAQARGNDRMPEYLETKAEAKDMDKKAGLIDRGAAASVLLLTTLGLGGALAAFNISSSFNKDRRQYAAAKKAVKQYSKQKTFSQPLDTAPLPQQVLKKLRERTAKHGYQSAQAQLPQAIAGKNIDIQL